MLCVLHEAPPPGIGKPLETVGSGIWEHEACPQSCSCPTLSSEPLSPTPHPSIREPPHATPKARTLNPHPQTDTLNHEPCTRPFQLCLQDLPKPPVQALDLAEPQFADPAGAEAAAFRAPWGRGDRVYWFVRSMVGGLG